MKYVNLLSCILLTGMLIAGCTQQETAEMTGDTTTGTEASGFNFQGDFNEPLGIQLWSVRNYMNEDVTGTLARVYEMGFREVELAGTYGLTPDQFRQELDNVGLTATAMHVPYERLRDSLEVVLNEAETLGVDYLGVAWIPHPQGPFSVELAQQAAEDFNNWGAAARERGLQFFYHIHGYEFQPSPDGVIPFDILVQETDPDNVKLEMDVLWATRPGQNPAELLRKYPDRWKLIHLKDLKVGASTNDFSGSAPPEDEVPVGEGQINFEEVLAAAEEIGLERYYIEDETTDPLGNIPLSISYLETIQY